MYGLAAELRSHGIKTGIVSNIYSLFAKSVRLLGDYRPFDPVILSCEVKIRKPDPAIFKLAYERCGVKAEETIFIDNLQSNIDAAKKLGMKAVLAENTDQTVKDVKEILLQENSLQV